VTLWAYSAGSAASSGVHGLSVIVVASWVFVGAGYETEGERWLALSAAARAREQRQVALEELRTMAA
jgi:hypothetical protein